MNDSFEKCAQCATWINIDTQSHVVAVQGLKTVHLHTHRCHDLYRERHDLKNEEIVRHPTAHNWRRVA